MRDKNKNKSMVLHELTRRTDWYASTQLKHLFAMCVIGTDFSNSAQCVLKGAGRVNNRDVREKVNCTTTIQRLRATHVVREKTEKTIRVNKDHHRCWIPQKDWCQSGVSL